MAAHPGQHVVCILPGGGCKDQVRLGIDCVQNIHAHALARDEAVPRGRVDRERAPEVHSLARKAGDELRLQTPAVPASTPGWLSRASLRW